MQRDNNNEEGKKLLFILFRFSWNASSWTLCGSGYITYLWKQVVTCLILVLSWLHFSFLQFFYLRIKFFFDYYYYFFFFFSAKWSNHSIIFRCALKTVIIISTFILKVWYWPESMRSTSACLENVNEMWKKCKLHTVSVHRSICTETHLLHWTKFFCSSMSRTHMRGKTEEIFEEKQFFFEENNFCV